MGTDRQIAFEGPCKCGEGKYIIQFCEPDHGYSANYWYECHLHCQQCSQEFELHQRGKSFYLVEKKELLEKEKQSEVYHEERKKLMGTQEVKAILEKFTLYLDKQPSMAAIHRLLSSEGLEHCSVATFRKRWNGGASWVRTYGQYFFLKKIMKILQIKNPDIQTKIDQLKEMSKISELPPKTYGKPIYKIQLSK